MFRGALAIAGVLKRLIRNSDAADLTKWLDTLYKIAIDIHPHAVVVEDESTKNPQDRRWNEKAINHPSGKLAEFWLHSISHWYNQQAEPPQALNPEYRCALDTIIEDHGIPGKLGRTILANEFNLLYYVDSVWTEQHLLPLFDSQHEDFSCAWDGYLVGRGLSLPTGELLKGKFIGGLQRAIQSFPENRLARFMQFYILVISYLVDDDKDRWIYTFFEQTREKPELKHMFTTHVGRLVRDLDESSQNEWWNIWLRDYWNNRLQGVPCPLDDAEIATMFDWVIRLQGIFPEVVNKAVQMKQVALEENSSLLDQIARSNLIDCYPNDLAKFLIHLGQADRLPWFWKQNLNVLRKLLEKDLPEDVKQELQETILRIDISSP